MPHPWPQLQTPTTPAVKMAAMGPTTPPVLTSIHDHSPWTMFADLTTGHGIRLTGVDPALSKATTLPPLPCFPGWNRRKHHTINMKTRSGLLTILLYIM